MKLKIIFGVLAVFCIFQEISATFKLCSCIGEGKDVCSCKKGLKAPRPYPLEVPQYKPKALVKTICKEYETSKPAAPAFKPIGDVCNCGATIVKPAPFSGLKTCPCMKGLEFPEFPKWEIKQKPSCGCSSCTSGKDSGEDHKPECGELKRAPKEYTFEFEKSRTQPAPQPKAHYGNADVVSVSIARRLANSAKNSVSERQLQYGSQKEPKPNRRDETRVIATNEDDFYQTKGQVIEIKKSMFQKPESSESSESSEETPKRKTIGFTPEKLKYDEIGYGTYHSHHPRYVTVHNKEADHSCGKSKKQEKSYGKKSKSCGCPKDLIVEETSHSEQSLTAEDYSGGHLHRYFSS